MSEKMPEWPDEIAIEFMGERGNELYERARYAAAMARLRVAVEALWLISHPNVDDSTYGRGGWCEDEAAKALTAIGPLPEVGK